MATTTATRPTIGERISMYWLPTFERDWPIEVTVTERKSGVRSETVKYVVHEQDRVGGRRTFLVAKAGGQDVPRSDEIYTVRFDSGRFGCTCKGSVCRHDEIECRHKLICELLIHEQAL